MLDFTTECCKKENTASASGSRLYQGSKPTWANSSRTLFRKTLHKNKGWQEWLKVKALSSSPSTAKKKKKENTNL
jgi:hypothetical protein